MAQKSVDNPHLTNKKKCKVALESHCIFKLKLESGKRQTYDDDDDDDPTTTTITTTTTTTTTTATTTITITTNNNITN